MLIPRIIPCLLIKGKGLVKGVHFKNHTYVGDPINAVKIFSEKEVDELILLDITATDENRILDPSIVAEIADEAFMPFVVGGGIRSISDIRSLVCAGAEKVCINTAAVENPSLIKEASDNFGSQSIIISIDAKKDWRGNYEIYTHSGRKREKIHPVIFAEKMAEFGAGEIIINSIEHDGTMAGYDLNLIKQVSDAVSIPVIACGGAGSITDLKAAICDAHASAVAAGSLFVFHSKKRGVLINFLNQEELHHVCE